MPIYKTTTKVTPHGQQPVECIQLIDAANVSQAIRHVAKGVITAEVCDTAEAVRLGRDGLEVERAGGES